MEFQNNLSALQERFRNAPVFSLVLFPYWNSNNGLTVGDSENGAVDPLTGFPEVVAVLWSQGQIIDLGTFGGNASSASSVNSRGQAVGAALNAIPDPFAAQLGSGFFTPPIFLFAVATQEHAFLWEEGKGMRDLGTLGSGTDSAAFYINEHGQVTGYSFTNSTINPTTGIPTLNPFLWEHGKMIDLGTLGGTVGSPFSMNDRGEVVGQSNLAGDQTSHPFRSEGGKPMSDLGTLGGTFGRADWINEAGHIVGLSSPPAMRKSLHSSGRMAQCRTSELWTATLAVRAWASTPGIK